LFSKSEDNIVNTDEFLINNLYYVVVSWSVDVRLLINWRTIFVSGYVFINLSLLDENPLFLGYMYIFKMLFEI
jgi:hypothetical protein